MFIAMYDNEVWNACLTAIQHYVNEKKNETMVSVS
jgi:hypothetical protein